MLMDKTKSIRDLITSPLPNLTIGLSPLQFGEGWLAVGQSG